MRMAGGREIDVVECEAEENRRPFSLGSSLLGSSLGSSTRGSRSLSLSRLQLAYSSSQSPSPSRSLAKRFWRRKSPSIDDPETPTTETDSHYDDIGSPSSACAPSPHTRMLFSVVERRLSSNVIEEWPKPLDELPDESAWGLGDGSDFAAVLEGVINAESLLVRVVTWNLQARPVTAASEVREQLLLPHQHHIIVIGSEECEHGIATSVVIQSKRNWETLLQEAVGEFYQPIRGHALQATHMMIFAHRAILPLISEVRSAAVATGLGKGTTKLGNKGGIGITFKVGSTRCLFVNCHLAAGQKNAADRNSHFTSIQSELLAIFRAEFLPESNDSEETQESTGGGLDTIFDRVVWAGDMNYRINAPRVVADTLLQRNMHDVMIANDQLSTEMTHPSSTFQGFVEGPLHFRPTYKFDKFSDAYDSSQKQRVPSWTDRILFHQSGLQLTAYNAAIGLRSSDHRPVYASFVLEVKGAKGILERVDAYASHHHFGATTSEVCSIQ